MAKLYSNRPGGTIARMKDGSTQTFGYGDPVDTDQLADHVRAGARHWADDQPRTSSTDLALEQAREAATRAAQVESNQVNGSQSPVPSNYADLPEDAAALLVANLIRYPEQQAALVQHEILFGGNRQKVIDAASEYAVLAANARIAGLLDTQKGLPSADEVLAQQPVASPGDPEATRRGVQTDTEYARRAHAALGGAAIKSGTPPPTRGGVNHPSAGPTGPAERDAEEVGVGTPGVGVSSDSPGSVNDPTPDPSPVAQPADESFDGWTNEDLDKYADQHDISGVKSKSHADKIKALRSAGHEAPQTPKPE
jgi:hypothetical protein